MNILHFHSTKHTIELSKATNFKANGQQKTSDNYLVSTNDSRNLNASQFFIVSNDFLKYLQAAINIINKYYTGIETRLVLANLGIYDFLMTCFYLPVFTFIHVY